jgi:hypothetical protein
MKRLIWLCGFLSLTGRLVAEVGQQGFYRIDV